MPTAGTTQELDPSDILEVQDIAAAIARAEQMVAAPRSSRPRDVAREAPSGPSLADMFESLGHRAERSGSAASATTAPSRPRLTDDAIGPATPAPPGILTPVPPRYVTMPTALPPAALAPEDDAYYHPAGRIRSLADATLDGYRPEPTLLVRAAGRRKRFSWMFVGALLPLLVLAAIAVFANADADSASGGERLPSARVLPSVPAGGKTPIATTSVASKATTSTATGDPAVTEPSTATGAVPAAPATPVFDVNSLPSASTQR